ncbi:large ribosomal subunit protein uL29m [Procambarus clarkii]|uniref:large ribosomal subunit protein uL29m n=1 Tax=Procambarus clarkii TaxID=6728 RepID=UPI003742003C
MAAVRRASSALTTTLLKLNRLHVTSSQTFTPPLAAVTTTSCFKTFIHTSGCCKGLSEFFDDEKNWGESVVKVGRAWKLEELRIKSNEDLHKLWYVLLKEKNMLLTMEHAALEEHKLFPSPERIDKVEESMKNLEDVVRERDRAYWLLETGETGERPSAVVHDALGRVVRKEFDEHPIPEWMQPKTNEVESKKGDIWRFQRLLKEKEFVERRKTLRLIRNHVCMLLRRFPHMDMDKLQKQYPEVDVQALRKRKFARGHHDQNQG